MTKKSKVAKVSNEIEEAKLVLEKAVTKEEKKIARRNLRRLIEIRGFLLMTSAIDSLRPF